MLIQNLVSSIRCSQATKNQDDLKKMAEKMPGCHRGGYALYERMTVLEDN